MLPAFVTWFFLSCLSMYTSISFVHLLVSLLYLEHTVLNGASCSLFTHGSISSSGVSLILYPWIPLGLRSSLQDCSLDSTLYLYIFHPSYLHTRRLGVLQTRNDPRFCFRCIAAVQASFLTPTSQDVFWY